MTTIYEAIMKAADTLDKDPKMWFWRNINVPACGTPACALGWIGHHLGHAPGNLITRVCPILNIEMPGDFYHRMDQLGVTMNTWTPPSEVAAGLRLYAAKYHKPVSREIPGCVLNIFNEVIAQPITVKPVDVPQL
jgi:hypothetical protein